MRQARRVTHLATVELSPAKLAKLPVRALTPEQYVMRFPAGRRLDRLVLRDIAAHADFGKRAGQVWGEGAFPSVPGIAERIGYCDRSVQYSLRRLVAEGRLELVSRPGRTNVCRIVRHLEAVASVDDQAAVVDDAGDNSPAPANSPTLNFAPGGAKVAPDRATHTNRNLSLRFSGEPEDQVGRRSAPTQAPPERRDGLPVEARASDGQPARPESPQLMTVSSEPVDLARSEPSPGWAAPPPSRPLPGASRKLSSMQPGARDSWRRGHPCPRCDAAAGEPCRGPSGPRVRNHNERRRGRPGGDVDLADEDVKLLTRREVQGSPCPQCGAEPREQCRGRSGPRESNHRARIALALREVGIRPGPAADDSPG